MVGTIFYYFCSIDARLRRRRGDRETERKKREERGSKEGSFFFVRRSLSPSLFGDRRFRLRRPQIEGKEEEEEVEGGGEKIY